MKSNIIDKIPLNARKILEEMISERIRGASYLAGKCLDFYKTLIEEKVNKGEIIEISNYLISLFPTVAPIYNFSVKVRELLSKESEEGDVLHSIEKYKQEILQAKKNITKNFVKLISVNDGDTIITHSYSSTVLEAIKALKELKTSFKVIITESRPDFEGIHLARKLEDLGIDYEIITDAQIGLMTKRAKIAIVGADCITKNYDVINKAGTFLLALSARYYKVPFYVLSESFKIHPKIRKGSEVALMERPLRVQGFPVRNVLFDVTPYRLVSGILLESGMLRTFRKEKK